MESMDLTKHPTASLPVANESTNVCHGIATPCRARDDTVGVADGSQVFTGATFAASQRASAATRASVCGCPMICTPTGMPAIPISGTVTEGAPSVDEA